MPFVGKLASRPIASVQAVAALGKDMNGVDPAVHRQNSSRSHLAGPWKFDRQEPIGTDINIGICLAAKPLHDNGFAREPSLARIAEA